MNGVPTNSYYTVTSDAGAQLNTAAETGIDSVAVNETLDSGSLYYALSFDNESSYVVWNSPARVIASDDIADHGGVDGNWYYRDNASTWTAAPSNTAEEAISLAVESGANNQMTGTELAALTSTDFSDTDGFAAGTLDVAATFYTTDAHNAPSVEDVTFTFAGASATTPGDPTVTTTGEAATAVACTPNQDIEVTLTLKLEGSNINQYILSEDEGFASASWVNFVNEASGGETPSMDAPFVLSPGDGQKTVYIKFRSLSGDQTETISITVTLDEAGQCLELLSPEETDPDDPEEPVDPGEPVLGDLNFTGCLGNERTIFAQERQTFMFGVATPGRSVPEGIPSQVSQVNPGDYIRAVSKEFDTVYCITEELERRPFIGETDYFTHTRSFSQTRWVTDETLGLIPLAGPMLPKIGTSLLKFESANDVYLHDRNLEDNTKGLLYWITTEEIARAMVGTSWADFVIDVSPTLFTRFDFGAPIIFPQEIDTSTLRERELLNERNAETDKNTSTMETDEDVQVQGILERFKSILPR